MSRPSLHRSALLLVGAVLALTGCTLTAESSGQSEPVISGTAAGGPVVLVTHESFTLPKKLIRQFEEETGFELEVRATGDAGTLTNKLVLTKDNPIGDVAFGVDNTFASRALDAGVFDATDIPLPPGADAYALPEGADRLVPVDNGNVCVNVDTTWFGRAASPRRPRSTTSPSRRTATCS